MAGVSNKAVYQHSFSRPHNGGLQGTTNRAMNRNALPRIPGGV